MKYVIASIFLFFNVTFIASCASAMKIRISEEVDAIFISLFNNTKTMKTINTHFYLGSSLLHLHIVNSRGKVMHFHGLVTPGVLYPHHYRTVYPNSFIGFRYKKSLLKRRYGLSDGVYKIRATYQDTYRLVEGSFIDKVISNEINMNFKTFKKKR